MSRIPCPVLSYQLPHTRILLKHETLHGDAFYKIANGLENQFYQFRVVGEEKNVAHQFANGLPLGYRFDAVLRTLDRKSVV